MNPYDPRFPQPMPGYQAVAPAPRNGFGTAGFVLGLIGLVFSFIPLIGVVAWPLVILGIVFACVGLARARAGRATNRGLAIAGLVCSGIGLLVCILYTAAFSAAVSDGATNAGEPAGSISASTPSETSGSQDPAVRATAGIGDEVRDGTFAFVVTGVETGIKQLGEGFLVSEPQGAFVLVRVTVTNIGNEAQMFSGASQKLIDAQGRRFDADSGAAVLSVPDSESFLNNINPGNSVAGVLVFDVPENVTPTAIELHDSPFSGGAVVSLAH